MTMTDGVLAIAIQQELMKLLRTVSRELVSISNTFDEIVAVVEGETEQEIGLNPPKRVRWGKTDPADYGTPTTIHVNDPKVSTMEQLFAEAQARRDRKAGR